jgi:hypothetical protein
MHITKVPNSYDDYKVEVSWSELKAVEAALSANHAGVIADETFARMQFYMARIPGPGEEKEKGSDLSLEQTQAKGALDAAGDTKPGELTPDDIPMPGEGDKPLPGGEVDLGGGEGGDEPPAKPAEKPAAKPGRNIELEDIPMPGRRRVL